MTADVARMATVVLGASLALLVWALGDSKDAFAQTVPVVLYVEGPDAETVRSVVLEALPPGIKLADGKAFRVELVHEGQDRPLGREIDPSVIDRVRRAARIVGVAAAVVVRVRRDQTAHRALLLVVPAWKTPATAEEATLAFASHRDDVAAVAAALGQSLEPYAPRASGPAEGPQETRTPAQLAATSAIDLAIAGGIVGRRFDYQNGIDPDPRRYTLFPAPALSFRGQLFPLVHARAPWADIGIVAEYVRIFSEMSDSSSAPADLVPSSFSAGLRARIHPGSNPRLIVGLSVEYAFASLRSVGPYPFELPDVTYRSVRPAVDARVSFGRFSLLEQIAYRAIVDLDAISTRFYAPQGHGLDAELGAALLLGPAVECRLALDYELHSFVFSPPAGATFGPGRARDQLYGTQLAIALML